MAGTGRRVRTDFTTDEDILLVKFIATYNPTKQNRSGNTLYKRLVENVDGKWNWSKTHPWPSWRDRYVKNADEFDRKIARYQKKKGINSEKQPSKEPVFSPSDEEEEAARVRSKETSRGKKRAGVQVSSEQRKAKRAKLDRDKPDSEKTEETSQVPEAGTSDQARSPVQGPSEIVSDVPPPPPKSAITLNIPPLPSRGDTLPVLSSQPNSPARTQPPISSQLPPSFQPPASSSQQVATPKPPSGPKRVLKHKSVSPVFRSLSPTPNHSTPLKKKILPKVVEGHFTTSLTDRLGHVRPGGRSEGEEIWPPVRGKKGKEREAAPGPTALIPREQERHPINGVVSRTSRPAVVPKREPEDQHLSALLAQHRPEREHHPFRQVPLPLPSPRNRSGADAAESPLKHRSTNGEGQLVGSSRDRQRDNVTGPSTSDLPPVPLTVQPAAGPSRLTTAAMPSGLTSSAELPHGQPVAVPSAPPRSDENTRLLNAPSLAQIPTGSASSSTATIPQTRVPLPISNSPFLPSNKDKGKGKQRDAEPPVTHAQRLLTRIQKQHRRQTVGGYEHDDPSIDLVRLQSASSTSRIPRSRGRTSASHIPHRHTFSAHSTPSTVPVNLPGYLATPGPAIPPVPLAFMTPADLSICASIGLDAALSHIAAAQGYTIEVVRNVYNRVGNLKDTEECVKGMREASEGWIGNKLEQRDREARRARRASSGRENGRESSESNDSDEAPRGFHGSSLRQAPPEQPTPNGPQVQHDPRLYEVGYQPHPTTKAALHNRALMGGGGRLSASRKASAVGRYRRKKDEVAEVDVAVDTSEDDDGEVASGEQDEEANADVERAEEESAVEKLFPESPPKGLQDQDAVEPHPEQDAGNEPELASDDAEQLDLDDHHHEFSQAHARFHATHVKRESLTPPPMYRPHGDPEHVPAQNGEDVLNGALSDIRSTRSVSLPRDVDEGKTLLSGAWHMRQMLEKQWGKGSMRKRVTQLLR